MSYILDALRRADSERERDRSGPPGLHSQMHAAAAPVDSLDEGVADEPAARPWKKLVGGLGLGLALGAAAWWWMSGRAAAPPAELQAVAPASALPSLPAPATTGADAPVLVPLPAVLPEPKPEAKAEPKGEPKGEPKRKPAKEKAERTASPNAVIVPQEAGRSEALSPPAKPPARKAAAPASNTAPAKAMSELPDGIRRQLPPLAVSGSMYSPQPASRMVVLDGQVLREGQEVAPGLVLESIGQKAATLSFRGERFQLNF